MNTVHCTLSRQRPPVRGHGWLTMQLFQFSRPRAKNIYSRRFILVVVSYQKARPTLIADRNIHGVQKLMSVESIINRT